MFNVIKKHLNFVVMIIFLLFSLYVSYNHGSSGIINYVDHNFAFNFSDYIHRKLHIWDDYIYLGFNSSTGDSITLFYYLIFYPFEKLGLNYKIINRLEYFLSIFILLSGTYYYLLSLVSNKLSNKQKLLIAFISTYALSNLFITTTYAIGLNSVVLSLGVSFYTMLCIRKINQKNYKYFIAIIPLSLFIANTNIAFALLLVIFIILFSIIYNDVSIKDKVLAILGFLLIWTLLNSYWIIPFCYSMLISPPENFYSYINNNDAYKDLLLFTSERYKLPDLFKLTPNIRHIIEKNNEYSLLFQYMDNWFIKFISYAAVFVTAFIGLLTYKKKTISFNILFLILLASLFLFLSKGINKPFGDIYMYLFDNGIIFKIFRDSFKWILIVNTCFMLLMIHLFLLPKKYVFKAIVMLFLMICLIPWFLGLMGKFESYDVPKYYFNIRGYLEQNSVNSNDRLLISFSKPKPTKFIFNKNNNVLTNNIFKNISNIPIVDLFSYGGGFSNLLLTDYYKNFNYDDTDINVLRMLGITYITVQKDIEGVGKLKYTDKYFNKNSFGEVDIYELKKDYIIPKVNLQDIVYDRMYFAKSNPTKYQVYVQGLSKKSLINLLYTYDNNWRVYLETNNLNTECNNYKEYEKYKIQECSNKSNLIEEFKNIKYIYKNSDFSNNHKITNKYWNSWEIDPNKIASNTIEKTSDGKYNLSLTIFYYPQIFAEIGYFIIFLALIITVASVLFLLIKRLKSKSYW